MSKRASGNLKNKGVAELRLHEQSPTSIVRMIFCDNVLTFLRSYVLASLVQTVLYKTFSLGHEMPEAKSPVLGAQEDIVVRLEFQLIFNL